MDGTTSLSGPYARDDLQDLWENVYSARTPRQITENVILPAVEKEKRREGIHLVAQVDGRVVMSLPMDKPYWIPAGFLFDNRVRPHRRGRGPADGEAAGGDEAPMPEDGRFHPDLTTGNRLRRLRGLPAFRV